MPQRRILVLCLLSLIGGVYCLFPTRNHYWDGIGFALAIEESPGLTQALFNPNHLFYNFLGYLIFHPLHWLIPGLRALDMLTAISICLSVGCAYLLFSMLAGAVRDRYLCVCLTLLFAFSATWWKFSTDANAYVPSVFFLMLAVWKMTQSRPSSVMIGAIHAVSMLLHQIAVLFFPVVVIAILRDPRNRGLRAALRNIVTYSAVASGLVISAYCWVWFEVLQQTKYSAFKDWVLSNGREEFSYVSVAQSLTETLRSSLRVFFGGRFSLALTYVETPLLVILAILLVCSLSLFIFTGWDALTSRRLCKLAATDLNAARLMPLLLTWIGSFSTFLCLWLTTYPYYRLFYLPALILVLGLLLQRYRSAGESSYTLASFMVVMILANFTFLIYPYSKTEATPPVDLALKANEIWRDDVIYFSNFNCDNWIFKYFNRSTSWRPLTQTSLRSLTEELQYLKSQGLKTWIDATALEEINRSQMSESFWSGMELLRSYGVTNRKHRIEFALVVPRSPLQANLANP